MSLENIIINCANEVLDLPKTNHPIGKPIDDAKQKIIDRVELVVIDTFFEDLILDKVATSEPITRVRLYEKLEQLRKEL